MTLRSVGEMLDEAVGYTYDGLPSVLPVDVIEIESMIDGGMVLYYRRPRLAQFTFSPYARTPVHDLPHDGVGVVALPKSMWDALARDSMPDFPPEMNITVLLDIAVERW